jgi:prepilin-type processing-associated H-X9-DG protein
MNHPDAVGPKVRSYSLNSYMDGAPNPQAPGPKVYQFFSRQADFALLGPGMLLTFIDVVPENLCHAAFITDMGDDGFFYHLPGRSHGNRGTVSFADGHAESRRWFNPAVTSFDAQNSWGHFYSNQSDMTDHKWLKARASLPKPR